MPPLHPLTTITLPPKGIPLHKIEQAIQVFLEDLDNADPKALEPLIQEFGESCKTAIRKCLLAKRREEPFKLRMSNIGKPLRQILLEKFYGREGVNTQMRLKMTYGYIWEALLVFFLKASGLNIQKDLQVTLDINVDGVNHRVPGMADLKIDGELYDTKSASSWSYDNKFASFDTLEEEDPFGYCGQALGYSLADKSRFAGWIVIDKNDGRIKVVPIPQDDYRSLARKYLDDFKNKIRILRAVKDARQIDTVAPCTGVVDEFFSKKPTGNQYLSKSCEFCACKYKCWPQLKYSEVAESKAKRKSWHYYVKLLKPVVDAD